MIRETTRVVQHFRARKMGVLITPGLEEHRCVRSGPPDRNCDLGQKDTTNWAQLPHQAGCWRHKHPSFQSLVSVPTGQPKQEARGQESPWWDFLGGPVAKTPSAGGPGSIPDQGTRSHIATTKSC